MNKTLESKTMTSSTIWKYLFLGILLLQAVVEGVIGGALLFNFPLALESGFGITYSSELDILGIALGLYLLLLTALIVLSIVWTHRANYAGIVIGMLAGTFLLSFGIAVFLKTGDTQAIFVDSIRGGLTIFFAHMAGKECKQQL